VIPEFIDGDLKREQCPHCQRFFNPITATRHIPKCSSSKSKPKPPPNMKVESPFLDREQYRQLSSQQKIQQKLADKYKKPMIKPFE
jgi:predicted amidophosphoribosyltransferase